MSVPFFLRMFRRARFGERLAALVVAVSLVASASPVSAHTGPAASAKEIERLYLEGQDRYSAKDFKGAAEAWTRLLNLMPESGANQATRENVLINILTAHIDAYRRMRNDDGTRQIEHLREGKKTLDRYYADFKQVHGDRIAVSAGVQEKGDELEQELAKAEDEVGATGTKEVPEQTDLDGDEPTLPVTTDPNPTMVDDPLPPQRNGLALIITGSVVAGVGLISMVTLMPIGVAAGKKATQDHKDAEERGDEDAMAVAESNGRRANNIVIAGGVVGGVLILGGAALLVTGIIKRKRGRSGHAVTSMTPMVSRGFGGLAVSGRF